MSDPTQIHINSKYRQSGTFDNFIIDLSEPIKFREIGLKNCIIPLSQYIINSNNNNLNFKFGAGSVLTCTIPVGNYTASQFVTQLQTSLNAVVGITGTFTVTYSSNTGVLTITNSTADFTFLLGTYPSSLNYILGFAQSDTTSSSHTLVAPYPLNLAPPNFLYLGIDGIGIKQSTGPRKQPFVGNWQIPLSGNSFSIIGYTEGKKYALKTDSKINQLIVSVRNDDGSAAGLLVDWAATFVIA